MESGPVETAISERNDIIDIILNVALISAGINILVTSATILQIGIGVILIIASSILIFRSKIIKTEKNFRFESAFAYNSSKNELFEIPGYKLSRIFKDNMDAAMAENSDIRAIWNNRPISDIELTHMASQSGETTSLDLTEEMLEYILLSRLSTITQDYFNGRSIEVEKYDRDEIPDILLENRFVELFSKPVEDRAAFQGMDFGADDNDELAPIETGEVVMATGEEGAMFEKFTLTLPKDCGISRDSIGRIVIESNEITLRLSTLSEGYSTHLDYDIVTLVEDIEIENLRLKKMNVTIGIEMGYMGLLKDISESYKWVDKFVSSIEEEMSLEKYKRDMEIPQLKVAAKITAKEMGN